MEECAPRCRATGLGLAGAWGVVMSFTGRDWENGQAMIKATPPIRCSSRQAPASQVILHVRPGAWAVSPSNALNASVTSLV